MKFKVPQLEAFRPVPLMQIHKHRLFQLSLSVVYDDRVVLPVEAMNESLDGWFGNVSDIRRRLPRFNPSHGTWGHEAERVDDHLTLHRLDRIYHDGNRTGIQLLE